MNQNGPVTLVILTRVIIVMTLRFIPMYSLLIIMKNKFVEIDGRRIGLDYEPYIVAELSANHNGDLKEAGVTPPRADP